MRRGRFHAVGSLLSSKYPNALIAHRRQLFLEQSVKVKNTLGRGQLMVYPLEQVTQRWLVCGESEGNKMPAPRLAR
jgi:hypothetical protein